MLDEHYFLVLLNPDEKKRTNSEHPGKSWLSQTLLCSAHTFLPPQEGPAIHTIPYCHTAKIKSTSHLRVLHIVFPIHKNVNVLLTGESWKHTQTKNR